MQFKKPGRIDSKYLINANSCHKGCTHMKVFISHKREDIALATQAYNFLSPQIECYLDEYDKHLDSSMSDLGDYFRNQLHKSSHLLAIVSNITQLSWWVPFEIGMATERDYPIATYSPALVALPAYLKKWPYLQSANDLSTYKTQLLLPSREIAKALTGAGMTKLASRAETSGSAFNASLKLALRQA